MKHNRRDFLKGLGGFTLAMPFLSSLAPLQALGQSVPKKRFIGFHHYNGVYENVWYPQESTTAANGYTAFASDTFYKQLSQVTRMSDGSLTENFKRDFDSIIGKMNLYRGLDLIGGINHDSCHFLCGVNGLVDSTGQPLHKGASIDSLISKSSNFYSAQPKFRSLQVKQDSDYAQGGVSWERNITTNSVTRVPYYKKPLDFFNYVFGSLITDPVIQNKLASMKITIGDVVLTDYRAKMNDRRISAEDKIRLSNFVDNLQEVQRRLASTTPPAPVSCTKPTKPGNYDYYSLLTEAQQIDNLMCDADIMAAAIACDLTRVAVLSDDGLLSHHDYSHGNPTDRDSQLQFLKYNRRAVTLVSRFVNQLNSMIDDPSTGRTVLDNSLVVWGSEISQSQAHCCESMPLVTFGGASGSIKTGYYIDYRQRPFTYIAGRTDFPAMGRSYTQFLITAMRSMGLQPAEYNDFGDGGGFGQFASNVQYSENRYEPYRQFRNQTLPFISNI